MAFRLDDEFEAAVAARKRIRSLPPLIAKAVQEVSRAAPRPFAFAAIVQVGGGLLSGATVLAGADALGALEGVAVEGSPKGHLVAASLVFALVAAGTLLVEAFGGWQERVLQQLVQRHTYEQIIDATSRLPLESFESAGVFDRVERALGHAHLQPFAAVSSVLMLISGFIGAIAAAVVMTRLEPLFLLALAPTAVPLWMANRRIAHREFEFTVRQTTSDRERRYLLEVLTRRDTAKELRAFGATGFIKSRYNAAYDRYWTAFRETAQSRFVLTAIAMVTKALLFGVATATALAFYVTGESSLAHAGAAVFAARVLSQRLDGLVTGVANLYHTGMFLGDFGSFLSEAESPPSTGSAAADKLHSLSLEDVSFTYPGSVAPAVAGVDIKIAGGSVVALVGANGSGKTTLAKLISGLYRPSSGRVLWNGVDLAEHSEHDIRDRVAVLFQDFVRYKLSARDNISIGQPRLADDLDAIRQAADGVGAGSIIDRLPAAYETMLSKEYDGGRELSGGEWQRIALARARIREADLVILDEPSASLDPRAEQALFGQALRSLTSGTLVLISHRFSTVRSADQIFVMDQGRIVESGTHDELMNCGGLYAELFSAQAAPYRDKAQGRPLQA